MMPPQTVESTQRMWSPQEMEPPQAMDAPLAVAPPLVIGSPKAMELSQAMRPTTAVGSPASGHGFVAGDGVAAIHSVEGGRVRRRPCRQLQSPAERRGGGSRQAESGMRTCAGRMGRRADAHAL